MTITDKQRQMYRHLYYSIYPPSVSTAFWTDDDWIQYIAESCSFREAEYDADLRDGKLDSDDHEAARGYN